MTVYEKITAEISEAIKENSSVDRDFTVDIPTAYDCDIYSNITKISNVDIDALRSVPCVENVFVSNGFLNFRLKECLLQDFLSLFEPITDEYEDDFLRKLSAYIQLAENEKDFAGETSVNMEFTPNIRRLIVLLMKFQSISGLDTKKARIIWNDVVLLLNKIESESENLKSFVITYEPLLIAARGSLVKSNL